MYIKSMVIDGFKSYAQRTEIRGFDLAFNAITGLNGSGKSNILDSICFLMGITHLKNVRATSLQELVYKNGQAGVTKATVSITFDNQDKEASPPGYEQYDEMTITRQVVVGGKNKYLINGVNATNVRVQDLFRSVQLNVNNPHFLIMQGRITKVLNMKPPEILSMIEEAAGTSLYEEKRKTCQNTISKKDAKLKEIDSMLREEIAPKMEKLKKDRSLFHEYQTVSREMDHLSRIYIAYQFCLAQEKQQSSVQGQTEVSDNIDRLKQRVLDNKKRYDDLTGIIGDLQVRRDQESGGLIERLQATYDEQNRGIMKIKSDMDTVKQNIKTEEKHIKDTNKGIANDTKTLNAKKKEIGKLEANFKKIEAEIDQCKEAYETAQREFKAIQKGQMTTEDGESATLNDQLIAANQQIKKCETDIKQAELSLKHSVKELKQKQSQLKKTEQNFQKQQTDHAKLEKDVEDLAERLGQLHYDEDKENDLRTRRTDANKRAENLQNEASRLRAKAQRFIREFRDPHPGFDRSKVKGVVAELFKVKDPRYNLAVEIVAGGKLSNVVVDSHLTGKELLERNCFDQRTVLIPLNKVQPYMIHQNKVRSAQRLVGRQNAIPCLDLIEFDESIRPAMEFVFGGAFVCPDMDTAKRVCYDPSINTRTVTLDGEDYSTGGTLTGGATPLPVLQDFHEFKRAEKALVWQKKALKELNTELQRLDRDAVRYRDMKHQLDMGTEKLENANRILAADSHQVQLTEINQLETDIEGYRTTIAESQENIQVARQKAEDCEYKLQHADELRKQAEVKAQRNMQQSREALQNTEKKNKDSQQEFQTLSIEVVDLEREIAEAQSQVETMQKTIEEHGKELERLEGVIGDERKLAEETSTELKQQKELLDARNRDINEKVSKRDDLEKENQDCDLKLQQLNHDLQKAEQDRNDAAKRIESYLREYDWITDERDKFGQSNTSFDFRQHDMKEVEKKLKRLQENKDKLGRNVNMRAMNAMTEAEEQYTDLKKKRKIVLNDRQKLIDVIEEMDRLKTQEILKAFEKVNADFGSIFTTLLNGANAKLVPPDNNMERVLEGLEVKVGFAGEYKDSLNELSGGQGSIMKLHDDTIHTWGWSTKNVLRHFSTLTLGQMK